MEHNVGEVLGQLFIHETGVSDAQRIELERTQQKCRRYGFEDFPHMLGLLEHGFEELVVWVMRVFGG